MRVRAAALVFALLISSSAAFAGDDAPVAPEAKVEHPEISAAAARPARPVIAISEAKREHRFFDVKNSLALSSFGLFLAGDSLSTQKGLSRGFREINPLARPFVNSRVGASIYSVGSFGLVAGGMYLAHKTGHHKLEWMTPFGMAAWEGFMMFRNFSVMSRGRSNIR